MSKTKRLFMATTRREEEEVKKAKFNINDHTDILIEILKHLDIRSLGKASCVCRQWCSITRKDTFWEHLCFHQLSSPPQNVSGIKTVVVALGGYKRLYMICLQPALSRLGDKIGGVGGGVMKRRVLAQVSLSLFCVDYYERLGVGEGGGDGGRAGSDAAAGSSLMFLRKPVNV